MTHVYSFFSHVLWPVYVPAAVLLIEPPGWRRRALLVFVVTGVAVGAYLLNVLVAFPIVSRPIGQHSEYVSPHFFAAAAMTLYLMSTTFRPLAVHASNDKGLRRSGAVILRRGILFLCDLVHLGVVLLRRADERGRLPSLCIARTACWP